MNTISQILFVISNGLMIPVIILLLLFLLKEDHDRVQWNQSQHIKYLLEHGDTVYANSLADSLRNFNKHFVNRIHGLMRNLSSGTAYDLLKERYGDPNQDEKP